MWRPVALRLITRLSRNTRKTPRPVEDSGKIRPFGHESQENPELASGYGTISHLVVQSILSILSTISKARVAPKGPHPDFGSMPKFKKRILTQPRYQSPDGTLDVTPERRKHWADQFEAFNAENLKVPIAWDHSEDPRNDVPVRVTRGTRPPEGTIGYLEKVEPVDDGKAVDVVLDIRRDEDASKVEANLAQISPVIHDAWKDGQGKVWQDVWTHVDLVQHPVDHQQSDFAPADQEAEGAIACSLLMVPPEGNHRVYRMQSDAMQNGDKKNGDDKKGNGDNSEADNESNPEANLGNEGDRLQKVLDALRQHKIVLSDDTDESNFLEHLEQALLTVAAIAGEGEMADQNQNGNDQQLKPEQPQFAAMSVDVKRQLAFASKQHRDGVEKRLEDLLKSGRCTPPEYDARKELPKTISLSLNDDGEHTPTPLESWIESREAVPKGTFWDPEKQTRLANLNPTTPPDVFGANEETEEDAERVADEVFGAKKPKAAAS